MPVQFWDFRCNSTYPCLCPSRLRHTRSWHLGGGEGTRGPLWVQWHLAWAWQVLHRETVGWGSIVLALWWAILQWCWWVGRWQLERCILLCQRCWGLCWKWQEVSWEWEKREMGILWKLLPFLSCGPRTLLSLQGRACPCDWPTRCPSQGSPSIWQGTAGSSLLWCRASTTCSTLYLSRTRIWYCDLSSYWTRNHK